MEDETATAAAATASSSASSSWLSSISSSPLSSPLSTAISYISDGALPQKHKQRLSSAILFATAAVLSDAFAEAARSFIACDKSLPPPGLSIFGGSETEDNGGTHRPSAPTITATFVAASPPTPLTLPYPPLAGDAGGRRFNKGAAPPRAAAQQTLPHASPPAALRRNDFWAGPQPRSPIPTPASPTPQQQAAAPGAGGASGRLRHRPRQ